MSNASDAQQGICEYVDELIEALRAHVPAALEQFDMEAIHQSRVATRRLKAALELIKPVLDYRSTKPLAKLGRKLRRRLGPLRDLDVMLEHLSEIEGAAAQAPGAEWLRDRLLEARQSARQKSNRQPPPSRIVSKLEAWHELRAELADVASAIPTLLAESVHSQLDSFIDQANVLRARLDTQRESNRAGSANHAGKPIPSTSAASRIAEATDPAAHSPLPAHDPHQVRIAGKALRYTLELARETGKELPQSLLKTFKRMQERLGDWHDYVVLAERAMVESIDRDLPLHDPARQRQVLKLIDFAMERAAHELGGFVKLWAKQGQSLALSIRMAFVLTQAAAPPMEAAQMEAAQSETAPLEAGQLEAAPADAVAPGPLSESKTDRDPAG